ncbi:MAG: hypothetical protein QOE93_1637 [Actinomycetota bacterium]|jgi:hypothetical protein|nr:hypothetical protein [Actinomycetota bacterium]
MAAVTAALQDEGDPAGERRAVLRTLSRGVGVLASGCLGGLVAGLLGPTASGAAGRRADPILDIQMLQTASSMETLLVDLYGAALGTGPLGMNAPSAKAIATITVPVVRETMTKLFAETQAHHREHRLAFQTLTTTLGGKPQNDPNPKYLSGVSAADLSTLQRLIDYAAVLEKIVTDTYLLDITMVDSVKAKEGLASVMAVEAQHLAILRAFGALVREGSPQLLKIPIGPDLPNLPPSLAATAFPEAIDDVVSSAAVAEPESGAVP